MISCKTGVNIKYFEYLIAKMWRVLPNVNNILQKNECFL